ncbi:MAG: F0F1 ATP synthase subunit delta [Propionibacteriaceae bacterium]
MSQSVVLNPAEARLGELDRALDAQVPSMELADELVAVVDLLDTQSGLRRALTDPARPVVQRQELVRQLLGTQIAQPTQAVVTAAVALHWASGRSLAAAIERQGVRAVLHAAAAQSQLDTVTSELFEVNTLVSGNHPLREALAERKAPTVTRQALVTDVFGTKISAEALRLVTRGVTARERTFSLTIEHYLHLAAALKQRTVAEVVVARAMTQEQSERLRAILAKKAGHDVDMHITIDPAVIGGVRVTLGDHVIEGTVADRITDVRRKLA